MNSNHSKPPAAFCLIALIVISFLTGCSKNNGNTNPIPVKTASSPTITALSVSTGPYTTNVTITGTGFSTTAASDQVFFNGVAATVAQASATQIYTSVPLAAGTGPITVTISGKTATGPTFTYQATEVLTILAGTLNSGSVNGPTTMATFNQPQGIATDASGNLYVADKDNNLIRKITPAGSVTTFAGSGTSGSADGTASSASFSSPIAIAVDAAGNVYVSDVVTIRKVTPAGVVSTLAGNGKQQAVDGTGTSAGFGRAAGLAVDASGNVLVADQGDGSIREITPSGVVTTLYKSSSLDPYAITLDKSGNIYAASGNQIVKITPAGVATTFAGHSNIIEEENDGTGTGASFYEVMGITIDATGNLYVLDSGNGLIRKITPAAVVTTIGGQDPVNRTGPIATTNLQGLTSIAIDASGNLYVTGQNQISKISMQ